MPYPNVVVIVASLLSLAIAVVAPALILWGHSVSAWIRIPVIGIVLTIMLGAAVLAGIAVQEIRISRVAQRLSQKAD